jgi:hypothetical protein
MKKTTTVSPSNAVRRLLSLNLFGDGWPMLSIPEAISSDPRSGRHRAAASDRRDHRVIEHAKGQVPRTTQCADQP